jgi:ATP-binding cassette, subfamily F, member 3
MPVPEKKVVEKPAPKAKPPSINRKPLESRIKRIEEQMAKLNARKSALEAQLADPSLYQDRARLAPLLSDQAYLAKELAGLESEWLAKTAELEQAG